MLKKKDDRWAYIQLGLYVRGGNKKEYIASIFFSMTARQVYQPRTREWALHVGYFR